MARRHIRPIVAVWGLLVFSWAALAKDKPDDAGAAAPADETTGSYRYFANNGPGLDARLYAEAAARAAATHMMLNQAQSTVNTMPVMMRAGFEESAEYRKAQDDLTAAQDAYNEARAKVLAGVAQTDADYKAAVAEQEKIGRVLAAGNLSTRERYELAVRKMSYGAIASRIESEALENDVKAKETREKMLAAAAKVRQMRTDFDASVRSNTEFQAARKALFAARVEAAAANAYVRGLGRVYGELIDAYYYKERDRFGNGYWSSYPSGGYSNYPYYRW
jgi:hypothetical protein